MNSGAGSAEPNAVVTTTGETPAPTTIGTSPSPNETIAGDATAGADQGATATTTTEPDPLDGIPSLDELNQMPDDAQYKKSLLQMRRAIEENFKPKLNELTEKYKVFEPVADRFQSPDELQQLVGFREKLYGWETDPETNQLVPATQSLVEELTQTAPERADFLAADLLNGMTIDRETGRQLPRIDLALEAMAQDPERRARALSILGGVEPTSVSPTWQPSQDDLDYICRDPANPTPEEKSLQDVFRRLPYDERQKLLLSDQDVVRDRLGDIKFKEDVKAEREAAQHEKAQQAAAREAYIQEQADNAGNEIVERQFKEGFANFAKNVCEKWQPIKPLDPNAPPQGMSQEQVTAANQEIGQINQGAAMLAILGTIALGHPDTRWVAEEFMRNAGILNEDRIKAFDQSRMEWANSARQFGNLRYRATMGKNGNGLPQDVSMLETNANRSFNRLIAQANATIQPIMQLMDKFFTMKAQSHNSTLNGAATARVPVSGSSFDPTAAPQQQVAPRFRTRQEIEAQYG